MELWACGAAVLVGISALWAMSGTQREAGLVDVRVESLRALEEGAARRADDPAATRALAQAYVDAGQPGLAVALVEGAPASVASDVRVRHVLARALVDEGRCEEALRAERAVVSACLGDPGAERRSGCDSVLLASALRRAGILEELVALGVEDAQAHPQETLVAYQNATREARIVAE